ncbi:MAG: glycosyltransferase family 39 protein [Verrucomicrobiota bacterium]
MTAAAYRNFALVLLGLALVGRFWIGSTFELTPQEAYLWQLSFGPHLDWGYWDSGIFVPWTIKLGTAIFGHTELGVRWISALIYVATGLVIFWAAAHWFNVRAAMWSVVLYMVVPLYTWDLLLMNEATCALGLMMLVIVSYREALLRDQLGWWILAALVTAAALHVSYFTLIWPLGFFLLAVIDRRRFQFITNWKAYLIPAAVAVSALPLAAWYLRPETVDLRRDHNLPLFRESYEFSAPAGLDFILEQIWLLSPGVVVGIVASFLAAGGMIVSHRRYTLLLALCVPGLALQLVACWFGAAEPEMMAAFWLPAIFLAGNLWVALARKRPGWRRAGFAIVALALGQTVLGLLPLTDQYLPIRSGLYADHSFRQLAEEIGRRKEETGAQFVMADRPGLASATSFYLDNHEPVYVAHGSGTQSQFDFWPGYEEFTRYDAILLTGDQRPPSDQVVNEFQALRRLPIVLPYAGKAGWELTHCVQLNENAFDRDGDEGIGGTLDTVRRSLDFEGGLPSREDALPVPAEPQPE